MFTPHFLKAPWIKFTSAAFIFCSCLFIVANAQQRVADSLRQKARQAKSDRERVSILIELGRHYFVDLGKDDSSAIIFTKCVKEAREKKLAAEEIRATLRLAILYRNNNKTSLHESELQRCLLLVKQYHEPKEEVMVRKEQALFYYTNGKPDSGLLTLNKAKEIARNNALYYEEAEVLTAIASTTADIDPDFALQLTQEGYQLANDHDLPEMKVRSLYVWAYLRQVDKLDTALLLCNEALAIARKHNLVREEVRTLTLLVSTGLGLKSYDLLEKYFQEGLSAAGLINSSTDSLRMLISYAAVEQVIGSYPSALIHFLKALEINKEINYPELTIGVLLNLSLLYNEQSDFEKTAYYHREAKKLIDIKKDSSFLIWYTYMVAQSFVKQNKKDSATLYVNHSRTMAMSYYGDEIPPFVLNELGDIYFELGNYALAKEYSLKSYFDLLRTNGDPYNIAVSSFALAKTYNATGAVDSFLLYSDITLKNSQNFGMLTFIEKVSRLLSNYYKQHNNTDSAFHYLQLATGAREKLYNLDNQRALSNISFTRELQQKELEQQIEKNKIRYNERLKLYFFGGAVLLLLVIAAFLLRANRQKQKARNKIEAAYTQLKSTQHQLIQSEKMASLGELTAGIAHEIQNPLNFVNNFSELNKELVEEMNLEIEKGNLDEVKAIAADIASNEAKILLHGKRADGIVKSMLQHSRSSTGKKDLVDLNALCDEYARLAYHGLRARDKTFNATLKTNFDESLSKVNIIPQDMGRVILNLLTNAFHAVAEKKNQQADGYEPIVSVSTKRINDLVQVTVTDNGNGIPTSIIDKIFQPFFTTKPTGQGTGLGLSLAYDIVKAHNGQLNVETEPGQRTVFIITLPL